MSCCGGGHRNNHGNNHGSNHDNSHGNNHGNQSVQSLVTKQSLALIGVAIVIAIAAYYLI